MKRWAKFNQREELEKAKARIYAPVQQKTSMAKIVAQGVVSFLFIYALLVVWLVAGLGYAS